MVSADLFSEAELQGMKSLIKHVEESKLGADIEHELVEVFRGKIKQAFLQCQHSGRTPALWVLFHEMVDTIKVQHIL